MILYTRIQQIVILWIFVDIRIRFLFLEKEVIKKEKDTAKMNSVVFGIIGISKNSWLQGMCVGTYFTDIYIQKCRFKYT